MKKTPQKLLLFLYSNKNITGCAVGLAALGLFFTGVIHSFWIEIVLGSYGLGYLAAPRNRKLEIALNAGMDTAAIVTALDKLTHDVERLVPAEVYSLVVSIKQSILSILPNLEKGVLVGDQNIYTIRQTAIQYLPETLKSYLSLPITFRNTYPVQDGKTSTQILVEQLTLLDSKMKEIVHNLLANDTQALIANGAFLREKFATQDFLTPV